MSSTTTTAPVAELTKAEAGQVTCTVRHSDGTMCQAPIYAKRLAVCTTHYLAAKAGDFEKLDKRARADQPTVCTTDGCTNPIYAKRSGLCSKHYVAARKA